MFAKGPEMTDSFEKLIESARLTGRVNVLVELRDWLNEKIQEAEKANEELREELKRKGESK